MSVRNREQQQEADAARYQEQIRARHEREAQARPDAAHRALMFLLHHAAINNPDFNNEARHHMRELDARFTGQAIEEPEKIYEPDNPTPATPTPAAPTVAAPDTAGAFRQSSRFAGRGGLPRKPRVQRPGKEAKPDAK